VSRIDDGDGKWRRAYTDSAESYDGGDEEEAATILYEQLTQ